MKKIDINKLYQYEKDGLINIQKHPIKNIYIAKYSKQTVFSGHWDEITLICRSLWFDTDGNILSNPFPKFHNHTDKFGIPIYELGKKMGMYSITEKMDGSYIVVARVNGEIIVSSSGSFTSSQSIKAQEMIAPYSDLIENGKTYLLEKTVFWQNLYSFQ